MPTITIDLTDEALAAYVASRGKGDNDMSDTDFVQACLISDITSAVTQQVMNTAQVAAAAAAVVPNITTDQANQTQGDQDVQPQQ